MSAEELKKTVKGLNEWPQWNTKIIETNSKSVSQENRINQVVYKMSGAALDENRGKGRKTFEIDEAKYSSFKKLLKVTVYANRFINHSRKKREIDKELTSNKNRKAELIWIKYIQEKHNISNERQLNEKQSNSNQI